MIGIIVFVGFLLVILGLLFNGNKIVKGDY